MKKITVRLDESVHTFLVRIAAERQVSLSQLINETLARFVMAEKSFEMMEARAARAHPGAMRQVLDRTVAYGLAPLHWALCPSSCRSISFRRLSGIRSCNAATPAGRAQAPSCSRR